MAANQVPSVVWNAETKKLESGTEPNQVWQVGKINETFKETYSVEGQSLVMLYKLSLIMQNACLILRGAGLSAIQLGIPLKMFVALKPNSPSEFVTFADSFYTPEDDEEYTSTEGCLSIVSENKLVFFDVPRHKKIEVIGKSLKVGQGIELVPESIKAEGFFASVLAHEIDHQNMVDISKIGTLKN
jgi:peptide deformylase